MEHSLQKLQISSSAKFNNFYGQVQLKMTHQLSIPNIFHDSNLYQLTKFRYQCHTGINRCVLMTTKAVY